MFNRLNLGQKLTSVLVAVLLATFCVGGLVLRQSSERLVRQSAMLSAEAINKSNIDMVDVFITQVERGADRLMSALQLSVHESFHLDTATTVPMGGKNTVALRLGGKLINSDFTLVDRFTHETGGVATIFVRNGNDFIRISTSLKKEDGSRAVGTALDHAHPAYERMLQGKTYRGPAHLFGRDYFTKYLPIKENNTVIGILFIGADFTDELKALRDRIKATKIGESGYAFVLNSRPGNNYGQLIVHPEKEGQNIANSTDADGRTFIKEMLDKHVGVMTYSWHNANDMGAREKVVAYGYNAALGWVIASGAYVDDLGRPVKSMLIWVGAIGLVLAVILPLLIYFTVRRLVTKPLSELQTFCQDIQASHDFTVEPPHTADDEVGKTCNSVSTLMATLRQTFGGLLGSVLEVDNSAHRLAESSSVASRQSEIVSDSASAMAASVEQMTVGINRISENANVASDLAKRAGEKSTEGGMTILRATTEMAEIAKEVESASEVISELGAETGKISSIISVIKDVADQTNLLALNAAIEAARAGESGRGFAVVADEVRKLAERTALSTEEIAGMVGSIQSLSEKATAMMDGTVTQVQQGARLAADAGDAITEIQTDSAQVLDVIKEITIALGEQSSASEQIAIQTENVARAAEENSQAASNAAKSASDLERLGENIRDRVQIFKI